MKGCDMSTPAEIKQKQTEFHEAIETMEAANLDYDVKKAPYIAAKAALITAIQEVDRIDNELEALQQEYEPQTPPGPA
jgi:hypothetical protein